MAKVKGVKSVFKPANYMGRGVASNDPGYQPNYYGGMGDYYGTAAKNPQGRMRGDSLGYRPVSRKQLGTPPKSVV
jgi:hypothetical protein